MSMNPLYQYVYTREDYDLLQDSIFTKDILGSSSWKGEEKILLYQDRIERWLNGKLIKTYHLNDFEGFIVDNNAVIATSFRSILLFKKYQKLSFYEKWIVPLRLLTPISYKNGFPDNPRYHRVIFSQSAFLKITPQKLEEFITGLTSVLSKVPEKIITSRNLKNTWHAIGTMCLVSIMVLVLFLGVSFVKYQ